MERQVSGRGIYGQEGVACLRKGGAYSIKNLPILVVFCYKNLVLGCVGTIIKIPSHITLS